MFVFLRTYNGIVHSFILITTEANGEAEKSGVHCINTLGERQYGLISKLIKDYY